MRAETALRAPNSMILVVSDDAAEVPLALDVNGLAGHTATCVAVGTVAEDDGEVAVVLTDEAVNDDQLSLADEAILDTRAGFVRVETVVGDALLFKSANSESQRVRIWVSNLIEPDQVIVELVSIQ